MEKYTTFWDIVKDWRYYDAIIKTKMYHPEFKEASELSLTYLTNILKDLLNCSKKEEIEDNLEDITSKTLKKFDRIVKNKNIINGDYAEDI